MGLTIGMAFLLSASDQRTEAQQRGPPVQRQVQTERCGLFRRPRSRCWNPCGEENYSQLPEFAADLVRRQIW